MPVFFRAKNRPSVCWKRTLYIMFFAQMISMIGFSSIFPFLPLYVKSLGTATSMSTDLLAGLVFSGHALTMMLASPIWGYLADRWGRKAMVVRSMFGAAVTISAMAFVRSAEELVALRMLQGLIAGVMGATNALVASTVPRGNAGYAMGLMQVAMGLGLGLGPIIGGLAADAFGYQAAFYITAALLVIAGVVVLLGIDEQIVPIKPEKQRLFYAWKTIFASHRLRFIYLLRFINQMGRIIFIPILPMFILSLIGAPDQVNSYTGIVIGACSAATAIFSIFLGRIGDRTGHRMILIICLAFSFVSFSMQSLVSAGWQLLCLQIFYGVALGGTVTGISALLANYTHRGSEGFVYGLDSSVNSAARVIGPLIGVSIYVWMGARMVLFAAALLYLIAFVLAVVGLPKKPNK